MQGVHLKTDFPFSTNKNESFDTSFIDVLKFRLSQVIYHILKTRESQSPVFCATLGGSSGENLQHGAVNNFFFCFYT